MKIKGFGEALPTQLHPGAQKKNKERGAEVPPPSSLLTMAGKKASPPNYAHNYKKVKKGESNGNIGNLGNKLGT
jgi:hypothetical protein